MATRALTIQEYYDRFRAGIQADLDRSDFNPGSMFDTLGGAFAIAANELAELMLAEFRKTYFATAEGDDLETLAIDHFGERFARPQGSRATVVVEFTRSDTTRVLVIPRFTVVETEDEVAANVLRFFTDREVMMPVGTDTISVQATSDEIGSNQNVAANTLVGIGTVLTDATTSVTNPNPAVGGSDPETDTEYRETIKSLLVSLAGATKSAIQGALLADPQIGFVSLVEELNPFIRYDINAGAPLAGAEFERIPTAVAYVADNNGRANAGLAAVGTEIVNRFRACGVKITVVSAATVLQDVEVALTIVGGDDLNTDPSPVYIEIGEFIKRLPVGQGFTPVQLRDYLLGLAIFQGRVTAINVIVPNFPVAAEQETKILPGYVGAAR